MVQIQILNSSTAAQTGRSTRLLSAACSKKAAACDLLVKRLARATFIDRHVSSDLLAAATNLHPASNGQTIRVTSRPSHVQVVADGWACRAHILPSGARQLTDLVLPTEILLPVGAGEPSAEMLACGPVDLFTFDLTKLSEPALSLILRVREAGRNAEATRLRARLVSLGRRDARERLAYFIADVHARLKCVDLVEDDAFACPLTQEHLADLLGLTPVHVNRVLARLRAEGVLAMSSRRIFIADLPTLHRIGGFDQYTGD